MNKRSVRRTLVRRGAPRRAAALQALLADIVASSDDAIFSRKLDGTISSWNGAAERIFGYLGEEIIGRSSTLLLPSDRPDETKQVLDSIRRGQRVEHFETARLRKDGHRLQVSMTVSPIRDARGRIRGASTIVRDITAQRELEAELAEIAERERQRLGQDLHDGLGQQLAGLELLGRTLARSLAKRSPGEARTARLLVRQTAEALRQTRALARGLNPVLERPDGLMLALEEYTASTSTVFRVKCRFRCDEPVLVADHSAAVHLLRIAQEAVTNALRHGRARQIEVVLARENHDLRLEVRDDGRGPKAPVQEAPGMGYRIMCYRALRLGGTLRLEAVPPRGMRLACVVPHPGFTGELTAIPPHAS